MHRLPPQSGRAHPTENHRLSGPHCRHPHIREDFKITKEHGQWFDRAGVHMMAIYHPSALLRDPRKRPESFEDLKKLQAKIREVCTHTG